MIATKVLASKPSIDGTQSSFLAILPTIQALARLAFRHLRCASTREDCIAEVVALAWQAFVALARRGKDARPYAALVALCCVQAVKAGHRLAADNSRKDVHSDFAAHRRGRAGELLPEFTQESAVLGESTRWEDADLQPMGTV